MQNPQAVELQRPVLILSCRAVLNAVLSFLQPLCEDCTFASCEPLPRGPWDVSGDKSGGGVPLLSHAAVAPNLLWDLLGFARELCWGLDRLIARSLPLSVPFLPWCLVPAVLWSSLCCRRGDSCSTHMLVAVLVACLVDPGAKAGSVMPLHSFPKWPPCS